MDPVSKLKQEFGELPSELISIEEAQDASNYELYNRHLDFVAKNVDQILETEVTEDNYDSFLEIVSVYIQLFDEIPCNIIEGFFRKLYLFIGIQQDAVEKARIYELLLIQVLDFIETISHNRKYYKSNKFSIDNIITLFIGIASSDFPNFYTLLLNVKRRIKDFDEDVFFDCFSIDLDMAYRSAMESKWHPYRRGFKFLAMNHFLEGNLNSSRKQILHEYYGIANLHRYPLNILVNQAIIFGTFIPEANVIFVTRYDYSISNSIELKFQAFRNSEIPTLIYEVADNKSLGLFASWLKISGVGTRNIQFSGHGNENRLFFKHGPGRVTDGIFAKSIRNSIGTLYHCFRNGTNVIFTSCEGESLARSLVEDYSKWAKERSEDIKNITSIAGVRGVNTGLQTLEIDSLTNAALVEFAPPSKAVYFHTNTEG